MNYGIDNPSRSGQLTGETAGFMAGVYLWMTIGLLLTALTGYVVSNTPDLAMMIYGNHLVFYGLLIAELILVLVMSMNIGKLSAATATLGFLGYAFLNGLTFSVLFLIYALGSMGYVFGITAGMFAAMALLGYVTKKDLSSLGTFFLMALVGIIIAQVANIFIHSAALGYGVSLVAVLVFSGLTAYDVQRIKAFYRLNAHNDDQEHKFAIFGALILYLDFINMFLNLLRLLGRRR